MSSVWGLYHMYFLRQRLLGHSMRHIIQRFSITDLEANNCYILDMLAGIFSHCVQNERVLNQTCKAVVTDCNIDWAMH